MFHKTNTILRGVDNISKNYIGIDDIVDSTILVKMSEFLMAKNIVFGILADFDIYR